MNKHTKNLWENQLAQFTGSEKFYDYGNFPSFLTDGTKFLCINASCYWLFDAIDSHIKTNTDKSVDKSFVVAELEVNKDQTATLSLHDGNSNYWAKQRIKFTDFPLPKITTWAVHQKVQGQDSWTHMLPSEY
tara:strand:- start:44 stop:439 length:396 start_codon:yes stop_codon:yes gene_type:complete